MADHSSNFKLLQFPSGDELRKASKRKKVLNHQKMGSVRNIKGKVYVDFHYMGERVREPAKVDWNQQNAKMVRDQLDRIYAKIGAGEFRFAEVFPESKKAKYFSDKENRELRYPKSPSQVLFGDFVDEWYDLIKNSGRVRGRTLLDYKGYIKKYLSPFFGQLRFSDLNKTTFHEFIRWAKEQKYRNKSISNNTINKLFIPLKMVCKDASYKFGWLHSYNPFFDFKKLPETDPYENIFPFTEEEQELLIEKIPEYWRPYFRFAFLTGLRVGELIGIKPADIDWEKRLLHVRRAITLDENAKTIEGPTKNKFSRRKLKLSSEMLTVLKEQLCHFEKSQGIYFFCTSTGSMVHRVNLRNRVWIPALKKAGLMYRGMRQTRHTFATREVSAGKEPLKIATFMGHRDPHMLLTTYAKYKSKSEGIDLG